MIGPYSLITNPLHASRLMQRPTALLYTTALLMSLSQSAVTDAWVNQVSRPNLSQNP